MAAKTAAQFVSTAQGYIGTPYVWSGDTPKGFDCSGLVYYVLRSMGVRGVPRTSEEQYAWATPVGVNDLQVGDLVFMNFPGEKSPGHVMIYSGNSQVVQAPKPGGDVQQIRFAPQKAGAREWGGTIVGYGRIPGLTYTGEPWSTSSPVGRSIYQAPPRPGAQEADFSLNPFHDLQQLGGLGATGLEDVGKSIWGAVSGVRDTLSAFKEAIKLFVWLTRPKHWAMMAEVVVGVILVGLGFYWLGSSEPGDVSPDVNIRPKDIAATVGLADRGPGTRPTAARREVRRATARGVGRGVKRSVRIVSTTHRPGKRSRRKVR